MSKRYESFYRNTGKCIILDSLLFVTCLILAFYCNTVSQKKRIGEAFDESTETVGGEPSESEDNDSDDEVEVKNEDNVISKHSIPLGPEQNDSIETRENTFQENV